MNVGLQVLDGVDDVGEDVADDRTQQEQNSDHDDGDQHQDQRILDQALALFPRKEQHVVSPPLCCGFGEGRPPSMTMNIIPYLSRFGKDFCVKIP